MHVNKKNLIKGNKYLIAFKGPYDYTDHIGMGIYTGKTDDVDGKLYGFMLDNIKSSTEEDPNWFPIESIFELK